MYTRKLSTPKSSVMLLGPRGTGKSTWIKQALPPDATTYDLLDTTEALRLHKDPSQLFREVASLKVNSWVVIDEVQKVPSLLNEVHRLIEQKGLRFILCGSSARKLRRGGANLLAGRARSESMFPLVSSEVDFKVPFLQVCRYGMLPVAYSGSGLASSASHSERRAAGSGPEAYLRTYAETYLQEEIRSEALTRNIGGFARFLEIAARQNGQITNVSNISRDAMVARQTVQGFFDIVIDTLIGFWLEPWKLKRATKQVAHPKFFFFDAGVARALSGRLPYPPSEEELGFLFETYLLHEVRAYLAYSGLHYPVFFWSSHDQVEVDLFCETRKGFVAMEIKSAKRWDASFNKGLNRVADEIGKKKVRRIGIYSGERPAQADGIDILPFQTFLKRLWNGEIIS